MASAFVKDARKAWTAIFIALAVLVGFIIWHRTRNTAEAPLPEDSAADESPKPYLEAGYPYRAPVVAEDLNATNLAEGNEVFVKDQEAGKKVFLSKVSLLSPGWVAVREFAGSSYGNILGAARFDAGVWQGDVLLLRATEKGRVYIALMYRDDGDGLFDFKKDTLVVEEGDTPVGMPFETY